MHVSYEKLSAVVIHQIRAFKYVKHYISNLSYGQKWLCIGKNKYNTICEAIYADRTKVRVNTSAENIYLKHNCFSNSPSEYNRLFRPYHTVVQSVDMEASSTDVCESLVESKAVATSAPVNHAVKDKGEKRKSEEIELPDKRQDGKKRKGPRGGKKLRPGERYVPPPKKLNTGVSFSQEHFQETSYYFEGGLRKVYPYYYDYKTYCKGRWIGKSLREVFSSEFRVEPLDFYHRAAKHGRIRLNETPVEDLDVILKDNDLMRNTVHRHEPPVTARPMEILEDNGEVVVVDKPASLPVHPCGRFRHNTVIFILGKEQGLCGLHTVHRLDRLTSGVLLFARTLEVSKRLDQLVRDRKLEKEYVCRVDGEFPEDELVCEEPILVVSFKVGLCRVDPKGKDCRTVFQRLSWNGHSSVVRCLPLTGRTHQIRVHLQFLGHPILNDPIYGSSAWGPTRAKGGLTGLSNEQLLQALIEEHRSKESLHLLDLPYDGPVQASGPDGANGGLSEGPKVSTSDCGGSAHCTQGELINVLDVPETKSCVSDVPEDTGNLKDPEQNTGCNNAKELVTATTSLSASDSGGRDKEMIDLSTDSMNQSQSQESSNRVGFVTSVKDPLCTECKLVRPDPTEKELVMYLHALRYKGPDFEYFTRMPDWAKPDWEED